MPSKQTLHFSVIVPAIVALALSSCSMDPAPPAEMATDPGTQAPQEEPDGQAISFTMPQDCRDILPEASLQALLAEGIELIRGPGSPSPDSIYAVGQTPEELLGGLSCLFAPAEEQESGVNIIVSVAEVDPAVRPGIIQGFIDEGLNSNLTADGAGLTYWRWGDGIGSAFHNALYQDAWYSAVIQPGDLREYERAVALVEAMRAHTTR
jgi:hypothetical protein